MKELTLKQILDATSGRLLRGTADVRVRGISTDSRTAVAGDLFFALMGGSFDGHNFLVNAAASGCVAAVVSREDAITITNTSIKSTTTTMTLILVSDTLTAYQDLAAYYRQLIDPCVIAVTGSVGKTTLKELIACYCRTAFRCVYTRKNYNNQIGVPQTIFEMEEDTQVLVLELGMERAGELYRLAQIARPDIAVITNVGLSHRGNFDNDDGIFHAKMEITAFLQPDGLLVINGDDAKLAVVKKMSNSAYRVCSAGMGADCDFRVENLQADGNGVSFTIQTRANTAPDAGGAPVHFTLSAPGSYNGISAALAAAALSELGIELADFARALLNYEATPRRLFPKRNGGVLILDDSYNASPDSMKSGLESLGLQHGARKIAVLGAMNDLGSDSYALHRLVGGYVTESGIDLLVTVGEKAEDIARGAKQALEDSAGVLDFLHFNTNSEAAEMLCAQLRDGDVYLVKGSNATGMKFVADALAAHGEKPEIAEVVSVGNDERTSGGVAQ